MIEESDVHVRQLENADVATRVMDAVEDPRDPKLYPVKVAGAANIDTAKVKTRVSRSDTCHTLLIITVLKRIIIIIHSLTSTPPRSSVSQEMVSITQSCIKEKH